MMRQIVPCEMRIDEIAGTWKLGQNKPDDVRLRAADPLEAAGLGQEVATLARLMRAPSS
jgi:transcriptional regulator